jgi:hypothetical protein
MSTQESGGDSCGRDRCPDVAVVCIRPSGPAGDVVLLRRSVSSSAAIRVSRAASVIVGSVGVGCGTPREK